MYKVSREGIAHMSLAERENGAETLLQYGMAAKDCLSDGKTVLSDLLEAEGWDCTQEELNAIWSGLKEMSCDATLAQFDKELKAQTARISQARNRTILQERWRTLTGKDTVKQWCTDHNAPLMWIVGRELQKAIETVAEVQKGQRTLDQNVQNAIVALDNMDDAILNDDQRIEAAFLATVGVEYKELFAENKGAVLVKAKLEIGNDMSTWSISDLTTLQRILKKAQQEKAKKEKLEATKVAVASMKEQNLRNRIVEFLEKHPEFCDYFNA